MSARHYSISENIKYSLYLNFYDIIFLVLYISPWISTTDFFSSIFCIVVILQLFEYTFGFKKQLISTTYCSFFANIYMIDSWFSMSSQYIRLKLMLSSNITHQNTYSGNSYFYFISKLVCHNVGLAIMNLLANFFNMRQFLITVAQWGQCIY